MNVYDRDDDQAHKGRQPLIVCERCGHTVQYHSVSFGTSCEFHRCECKGWKINPEKSDLEHLALDGRNDLI